MKKLLLIAILFLIQLTSPNVLKANEWHNILGIEEDASGKEIDDKYKELKQDLEEKIENLGERIHRITDYLEDIKVEINKLENMNNIAQLLAAQKNKKVEFSSNMYRLNFLEQQLDTIFDAYKELTKDDQEEMFEME